MNLCEKIGVSSNVYKGFSPIEKDADFRGVKKLFFALSKALLFCKPQAVLNRTHAVELIC